MCKRVVYQTLVKYYKKLVSCKKNTQKWVLIYETCECDIGAPDIHRFLWIEGLSTGPRDRGVTKIIVIIFYSYFFMLKQKISFLENKHFPSLDDLKI